MTTRKIKILIIMLLSSSNLWAEPLQDGFRYGAYGVVGGALVGGASMAFSEDPGSNLAPVARGASLGLYAGLIVAVFKNINGSPKDSKYDIMPVGFKTGSESSLGLALTARF